MGLRFNIYSNFVPRNISGFSPISVIGLFMSTDLKCCNGIYTVSSTGVYPLACSLYPIVTSGLEPIPLTAVYLPKGTNVSFVFSCDTRAV